MCEVDYVGILRIIRQRANFHLLRVVQYLPFERR